jgi:hypothetical protein
MNIFMAKPMATYEYDDYERTEAYDQCDPMMGLSPVMPDPHFDWVKYYEGDK